MLNVQSRSFFSRSPHQPSGGEEQFGNQWQLGTSEDTVEVSCISRYEDESLWDGGERMGKWGVIASSPGWSRLVAVGGGGWSEVGKWVGCWRQWGCRDTTCYGPSPRACRVLRFRGCS